MQCVERSRREHRVRRSRGGRPARAERQGAVLLTPEEMRAALGAARPIIIGEYIARPGASKEIVVSAQINDARCRCGAHRAVDCGSLFVCKARRVSPAPAVCTSYNGENGETLWEWSRCPDCGHPGAHHHDENGRSGVRCG